MTKAREEQNIKRRVYDALNVLISSDVLVKDHKAVYYRPFFEQQSRKQRDRSTSTGRAGELAAKKHQLLQALNVKQHSLKQKKAQLQNLLIKAAAVDELLKRNQTNEDRLPEVRFPFVMVTPPQAADSNTVFINDSGNYPDGFQEV